MSKHKILFVLLLFSASASFAQQGCTQEHLSSELDKLEKWRLEQKAKSDEAFADLKRIKKEKEDMIESLRVSALTNTWDSQRGILETEKFRARKVRDLEAAARWMMIRREVAKDPAELAEIDRQISELGKEYSSLGKDKTEMNISSKQHSEKIAREIEKEKMNLKHIEAAIKRQEESWKQVGDAYESSRSKIVKMCNNG